LKKTFRFHAHTPPKTKKYLIDFTGF